MTTETEILKFNPCIEAVNFRSKFNSFEEAWNNCHRGDWMLWIAARLNIDFKLLTKAKAKCLNCKTFNEGSAVYMSYPAYRSSF